MSLLKFIENSKIDPSTDRSGKPKMWGPRAAIELERKKQDALKSISQPVHSHAPAMHRSVSLDPGRGQQTMERMFNNQPPKHASSAGKLDSRGQQWGGRSIDTLDVRRGSGQQDRPGYGGRFSDTGRKEVRYEDWGSGYRSGSKENRIQFADAEDNKMSRARLLRRLMAQE